jgi:Fe-Mn family superoxide dismutase
MSNAQEIIERFVLPVLHYSKNALEPHISEKTMDVHFGKHHQTYVDKLNQAMDEIELSDHLIEELLQNVSNHGPAIRNNAGGHYNHTMFWKLLTPDEIAPHGKLKQQIEAAFESFDNFKEKFTQAAMSHFGSGWAWLVLNNKGMLEIGSTPNQDNPLMDDVELKGYPIIGLDMWEHAYYLDYQNEKAKYVDAFWKILNWDEASNRYAESLLVYKSLK